MTHLRIELNNGVIEEVSSAVIEKLYDIVFNDTLDNTSNLLGRLHTGITYRSYVEYLTTHYPDLYINADGYAIPFEDSNMVTYLNSIGVGSNGTITEALAAAATIVASSANTTVTKFNELRYFTSITESRGGLSGNSSGWVRFSGWTALLEVDISNFTSLGHDNGRGYEDTFNGCTSLNTVTASNKLSAIGHKAFYNCTNLLEIIGLSGDITIHGSESFYNCTSLEDSSFSNVAFNFGTNVNKCFLGCSGLTEITVSSNCSYIPDTSFHGCTNLEYVYGLTGVILIYGSAFQNCNKLKSDSFSNCSIYINDKNSCFYHCTALTSLTLDNTTTSIGNSCFEGCTSLSNINLDNVETLGNYALKQCPITALYAPLCTSIGTGLCVDCTSMTTATLGNVTNIPGSAFVNCSSLATISGLSNVTSIGSSAFKGCSLLTTIDLGSSIQNVSNNAFYECNHLNYTWPTTTINIPDEGSAAFYNCSITFPSTLTLSTTYTDTSQRFRNIFRGCDLSNTDVILDSSVTKISSNAFFNSHAKSITANYLETGGDAMFRNVNATEIILPAFRNEYDSYDVQSYYFFSYCPNLTKVVLGHWELSWPANSTFDRTRSWFNGSVRLKYFDIGDSVPSIHVNAKGGNFSLVGSGTSGVDSNLSGTPGTLSLETFVIRNTTVPEIILDEGQASNYDKLIENFGGSHVKIYVPDASLNNYKTAQYWSTIASHIYPISELPT